MKYLKYLFLLLLTLLNGITSYGQSDFESKESKQIIARYKIKEIISYLSPEERKHGDSILVDHMFFDKRGLCIQQVTNDYNSTYHYNAQGQRIKEIAVKNRGKDSVVTALSYDERGNLIQTKKLSESKNDIENLFFNRLLTYNSSNEILTETWGDKYGKMQINERHEYLYAEPNSDVLKVIKYYSADGRAVRLKKFYSDRKIIMYDIGDNKNNIIYEQFLDEDGKVTKVIDHQHRGPHSFDMVKEFGHGVIQTSVVTELYKYNKFGLCSEKLIYKENKLIERQTWSYKL